MANGEDRVGAVGARRRSSLVVLCVIRDADLARTAESVLRNLPDLRVTTFAAKDLAAVRALLARTRFDAMLVESAVLEDVPGGAPAGQGAVELLSELALQVPVIAVGRPGFASLDRDALRAGARDAVVADELPATLPRALRAAVDLAHAPPPRADAPRAVPGRTIGFVGARGGVGTTTALLNCAAALARQHRSVIAAEITAWTSAFRAQLGQAPAIDLGDLLSAPAHGGEVDELQLTQLVPGVRLLCGPPVPRPAAARDAEKLDRLVLDLAHLADTVLVDLPASLPESVRLAVRHLDHVVIVTPPYPALIASVKTSIARLLAWGMGLTRMSVLIVSRDPEAADALPPDRWMQDIPVALAGSIPSASVACAHACGRGLPVVLCAPDNPVSASYVAMTAEVLAAVDHQRLKVVLVEADDQLEDYISKSLEDAHTVRFELSRSKCLGDVFPEIERGGFHAVLLAPRGSGEDLQRDLARVTAVCGRTAVVVMLRLPSEATAHLCLTAGAQDVIDLDHRDSYWFVHCLVSAIDRQRLVFKMQAKTRALESCELSHRRLITQVLRGVQHDPRMV